MNFACPVCKQENTIDLNFKIEEYICNSCSQLIDITQNKSTRTVKKPINEVILEVGQKGIIAGTEYTITGIVIRKYGNTIFWKEYYLKDKDGKNAFLSESDGHWVFLLPKVADVKSFKWHANVDGKNYRWYESTPCHIYAATGFFEDKLNFGLSNYKEYINGTQMISIEESGNTTEVFWGRHIPKGEIRKIFKPKHLPSRYGIGVVQPFYWNVREMNNIIGVAAIIIALFQLFIYLSRTNKTVFSDSINFHEIKNKELITNSFELSGGSAPLEVKAYSAVDNSWANLELSLVNEQNNEITYTSQDIEQYHGVEDGESWSEGGTSKDFNFCGVAPGKYHFRVSAEKQGESNLAVSNYTTLDGIITISRENSGFITVKNNNSGELTTFDNLETLKKDGSASTVLLKEILKNKDIDSLLTASAAENNANNPFDTNKTIDIRATWLPVSLWNFGIVVLLMGAFVALSHWAKYMFEKSKWSKSSNSPYPQPE